MWLTTAQPDTIHFTKFAVLKNVTFNCSAFFSMPYGLAKDECSFKQNRGKRMYTVKPTTETRVKIIVKEHCLSMSKIVYPIKLVQNY